MTKKLLFLLVIIELVVLVLISPKKDEKLSYKYLTDIYKETDINKVKLENYVIGVVAAEMPATFSFEALKAQAVAARTFAYKKILNNTKTYDSIYEDKGQAYLSNEELIKKWGSNYNKYYDIVSSAVLSTKGEVITYKDDLINAYYFSISNGKTEDSISVFGEADYLMSVDSQWDLSYSSYSKTMSIDISEFKEILNLDGDINISDVDRSSTNHVNNITINNKKYNGVEFRKLLNLRSTDFNISIDNDKVNITTNGYGHGVGMSQYGANSMAKEGKTYEDIIRYYYKGVKIIKI